MVLAARRLYTDIIDQLRQEEYTLGHTTSLVDRTDHLLCLRPRPTVPLPFVASSTMVVDLPDPSHDSSSSGDCTTPSSSVVATPGSLFSAEDIDYPGAQSVTPPNDYVFPYPEPESLAQYLVRRTRGGGSTATASLPAYSDVEDCVPDDVEDTVSLSNSDDVGAESVHSDADIPPFIGGTPIIGFYRGSRPSSRSSSARALSACMLFFFGSLSLILFLIIYPLVSLVDHDLRSAMTGSADRSLSRSGQRTARRHDPLSASSSARIRTRVATPFQPQPIQAFSLTYMDDLATLGGLLPRAGSATMPGGIPESPTLVDSDPSSAASDVAPSSTYTIAPEVVAPAANVVTDAPVAPAAAVPTPAAFPSLPPLPVGLFTFLFPIHPSSSY